MRTARSVTGKTLTFGRRVLARSQQLVSQLQVSTLDRDATLAAFRTVGSHPATLQRSVDLLLASGLFDVEFYRAQQPGSPKEARLAVRHFLTVGMPALASFHPAILPGYLAAPAKAAWRRGDLGTAFAQLGCARGLRQPWAPWFSPRQHVDVNQPGPRRHIFVAVLRFLQELKGRTLLQPDPALPYRKPQEWQRLRNHAIAAAKQQSGQVALLRPRWSFDWDERGELAWLAALQSTPELAPTPTPMVSVIMPAWNRETVIATAIKSVQSQSISSWELLVVDDGSTDRTAEVVSELAGADPRVRLIRGDHGGVCAARNLGLENAHGRYVAFLDTDNTWRPHFLETSLRAMARDGLDFVYCASKINRSGEPSRYRGSQTSLDELRVFNHIDLNVVVVTTALVRQIGGFDPELRRWVDHDLAIRLTERVTPGYLPFIGCDYYDFDDGLTRITTSEADYWQYVVLGKAWCDWAQAEAELPNRVTGRVSVVMPVFNDVMMTTTAVRKVLEASGDHDVEVIVIDNGSRTDFSLALEAAFFGVPSVRLQRMPMNLNFGIGSNVGVVRSTGELILFLNNDTEVRKGWLAPLIARLQDPQVAGVQPLLIYDDDTIQSAGTIFPLSFMLPTHFLTGFPIDDANQVDQFRFSAATAAALLMRASEVIALRGFDPAYVNGSEDVDLCLRAIDGNQRYFAVEPRSIVLHLESQTPGRGARIAQNREFFASRWRGRTPRDQDHYARHGFEIVHAGVDQLVNPAPRLLLRRVPRVVDHPDFGQVPVLRWGIRNPATPARLGGDRWGDTHFAALLAQGLRSQGQEAVATRRKPGPELAMAYDDVSLVIRGLWRTDPQPGKINILWVISHPEKVSAEEVRGFDLVFAASTAWAKTMTEVSGRLVLPLLQATDPSLFHPEVVQGERHGQALFVGQARSGGVARQVVMDAIAAQVELEVWGPNWSALIDSRFLHADYLPHDQVPAKYRSSSVVLNDHWPDMADQGFFSNRLFDAVATGARVVSDPVDGLAELFGGAVQTYSSPEDLGYLCSTEGLTTRFPSEAERLVIAEKICRDHSFAARAHTLLEEVLKLRGQKPGSN